jgi:hypothetical protein
MAKSLRCWAYVKGKEVMIIFIARHGPWQLVWLEVGERPFTCHLLPFSYCILLIVLHKKYVSCTMGKLVDFYLHTNIKITNCKVHTVMKLKLYIVSCWHPFELFDLKLMIKPFTCQLLSCNCYILLIVLEKGM